MADGLRLNRLNKFYGGITIGDRDKREGVCLNAEEIDIFTNPDFIEPETILASDTTIGAGSPNRVWGFTVDDAGSLYAISDDAAGTPKAKIFKLTSAGNADPGDWAAYFTSAQNARDSYPSNIIWHGWGDPVTTAHLYFVTGSNSLYKYGDIKGTPSESSVGTLSGISATSKYVPFIRVNGELFIGHGQFVAKVDGSGTFTQTAFTLPNEWECTHFVQLGDELAILARSVKSGYNESKVFFWDMTATTGVNDEITIPMGNPQAIVNHNEILRVFCVQSSLLRIYELNGKIPVKTHEIDCNTTLGVTNSDYTLYYNSVFVKNNIVYFGLARGTASNTGGLYALGRSGESRPLALVLAKRYTTSNASATNTHKPLAAVGIGTNIFATYIDLVSGSSYKALRVEEANSPTRSSNAIYESIWIDADTPETIKEWPGMFVAAKPIPASCTVTIDARVDNASSYDSNATQALTNANDQTHDGGTADTFWYRMWTSVVGRVLQLKITFTSSGTSKATVYLVSVLSRETNLV